MTKTTQDGARRAGPVVIRVETPGAGPETAPPVPDPATPPAEAGRAMRAALALAARPPSRIGRLFWAGLGGLVSLAVSVAAWDFVTGLLARSPVLGTAAAGLAAVAALALAVIVLRELAAVGRMRRLDAVHGAALAAAAAPDMGPARAVATQLDRLYAGRADLVVPRARLADRRDDPLDPAALLSLAEVELMTPLDAAARAEVEAAARTVATVTALVPLALADVATALVTNLRMIRRIAEIYGGRAGTFGSWRLARAVFAHLAATGAVAVGDDLVHSIAGGGVVSKLSRRFGEGMVNGALTARVGIAAIEVCRPLPFATLKKPRVSGLVGRALAGLFDGVGRGA